MNAVRQIKIRDLASGQKNVVGAGYNADGSPRCFTWGAPWMITTVVFSHHAPEHEFLGKSVPAMDIYKVSGCPVDGREQSISPFGEDEVVWVKD